MAISKYDPLTRYLNGRDTQEVPMSFQDIERILGFKLPEKASGTRAWWSNNPSNNVMTKAWLAAGYATERVDMGSRRLVFRRTGRSDDIKTPAQPSPASGGSSFLDRIRSRLGGTVTVPTGADLTTPTGESWDAEAQ